MAASLTEATPSTTSPSDGIMSPASTSTTSPTFRLVPGTILKFLISSPFSSFAWVSVRVRRSDSACALPRPSATASAKLAKSTVNQSQTTIWNEKPMFPPPVIRSRRSRTVVKAETTATTNITGFRASASGLSFRKASPMAGMRMRASMMLVDLDWLIGDSSWMFRTHRDRSGCCEQICQRLADQHEQRHPAEDQAEDGRDPWRWRFSPRQVLGAGMERFA
ncbi:hypothetical protein ABIE78_004683 [Sinorhizobium fredii]